MSNLNQTTPRLYPKQGCPWCKKARDILNKNDVSYQEISVTENEEAFNEMQRLSGQTFAPVLEWNGEILADFGPEELVPFLAQRQPIAS
jgi:glutaredoxin 3